MHPSATTVAGPLLMALAVGWLALPGTATTERGPAQAQPAAAYVGEATCLTCHDAQTKGYHAGAHGRASNVNAPLAARGCESCHGPGSAHVENPADRSAIVTFTGGRAAADSDAACLQCHTRAGQAVGGQRARRGEPVVRQLPQRPRAEGRRGPAEGGPAGGDLRAVPPAPGPEDAALGAHAGARTSGSPDSARTSGALACSSCHNAHGTTGEKLLKAGGTVNATCESCHAEKRGPFLWEHAPVVENCTTCHDAHGSSNDRMLVAKEPFLCQRCHVSSQHPTTAYDLYALSNSTVANRMSGRSCAACHQNVHGSNAPSGKAFLR